MPCTHYLVGNSSNHETHEATCRKHAVSTGGALLESHTSRVSPSSGSVQEGAMPSSALQALLACNNKSSHREKHTGCRENAAASRS